MKSPTFTGMKAQLKTLAETIRSNRQTRSSRSYAESYEFRHLHLAYGLLRGRTMEQMERTVRESNKRNERHLERLLEKYRPLVEAERAERLARKVEAKGAAAV